jgi:hypothetical protein
MRDLGIEFISVFGLPPVDFVHLAADLGCRYISTALIGRPLKSLGYQAFSLKDDARLRQHLLTAMDDRGVSISLGEGMLIVPGADVSDLAADLDVMAEIGAAQINTLSFDPDRNRTFDQLATLTQMAAERGIGTTIELAPGMTIGNPATVLAAIEHVGRPDLRLALDTMHWARGLRRGRTSRTRTRQGWLRPAQRHHAGATPEVLHAGSDVRADGSGRRGAPASRDPRDGAGRCGDRSGDSDAGPGRVRRGPHGPPSTMCGRGT